VPGFQPYLSAHMDLHGEVVLRQRVCLGVRCHAVLWICKHCDSRTALLQFRLPQRSPAWTAPPCQLPPSAKPGRRLDHSDRQREYRRGRVRMTIRVLFDRFSSTERLSASETGPAIRARFFTTTLAACCRSAGAQRQRDPLQPTSTRAVRPL
jgi:hypothetical protein